MKKIVSSILALLLALTALSGMALAETAAHEITTGEFPLYVNGMDIGVEMPLYFLDGIKDLPYVELNDWMELVNLISEDDGYVLSLETDGSVACYTNWDDYTMVIDFDANTFSFMDYNLFMKYPRMSTLLDFTSTDCFNEAGEPVLLKKSNDYSYERYGDELVIRLGDYNISLSRTGCTWFPSRRWLTSCLKPRSETISSSTASA